MEQVKNLKDVINHFSNQQVCWEYLENMRWNGNPVCPFCNATKPYRLKDGKKFRCSSRFCKKDFNVLTRSVMENTKIPLSTWLAAIYLGTAHKKGISSCQLSRDLGITQKTAWFLLHRIREMVKPTDYKVLDEIVELDETWVGGKMKNKSKKIRKEIREGLRPEGKTPVFGMVKRDGGVILKAVKNADNETLRPIIREHVSPNSVIVTDGATYHEGLENDFKGHVIVNHSQQEYVNGMYHTNTIEGVFSIMKRGIYGIYHQISPKHLQRYCEEFSYRYSSRKITDGERFKNATSNIEGRITYNKLIEKQ